MQTNELGTAALVRSAMRTAERSTNWTAEKAGIPASTFRRKVAGHADFTVSEVARVAAALAVNPLDLVPFARADSSAA